MTDNRTATSASRRGLVSWALFDWANSAFPTVILTFVFSAYLTRQVAENEIIGSTVWGTAIGASGLLVAVLGPLLGAATDQTGRRKPWIFALSALCISTTALLWFIYPDATYLWPGALLAALGATAIDLAIVFYNAMLPQLAPREHIGRWSGRGWGLGYAGGLVCLGLVLLLFVEESTRVLPFGDEALGVRASFLFVAGWFAVFALPLFLLTPDTPATGKSLARGLRDGYTQLRDSIRQLRRYRDILRFLIARIFYVDGLATLFAFGGVYAAGSFDMDTRDILLFGIALNISAGLGAFFFAGIDDRLGSRRTILLSLGMLILAATVILLVTRRELFWAASLVLGFFIGPVQAASRSYLAHLAPSQMTNQMFGLYAFSGKATAFIGPLLVGWITAFTNSQRIGMSAILVLFVIGFVLMLKLPPANGRASHR